LWLEVHLDAPGPGLLRLRQRDGEHAVLGLGADAIGLHGSRKFDRAQAGTVAPLDAVPGLSLLLLLLLLLLAAVQKLLECWRQEDVENYRSIG
jgi:hypothetical protein